MKPGIAGIALAVAALLGALAIHGGMVARSGTVDASPQSPDRAATGASPPRQLGENGGKYPSWSPNGRHIAFIFSTGLSEAGSLYVVDADGSNLRELTSNITDYLYSGPFAWSPDSRRIAFVSGFDESNEIHVIDADGGNLRQLTHNNVRDVFPSWSADSRRIAFVSRLEENGAAGDQIYVIDADGSNLRQLTSHGSENRRAAWSPNGSHIAFDSWDIQAIAPDGSDLRNLTNTEAVWEGWPLWSPNSRHIAYIRQNQNHDNELWVMDFDGGNQRMLTLQTRSTGGSWHGIFAWSPDSYQIAFETDRDGNHEIYVIDLDGSNLHRLTNNSAFDGWPAWSPDGDHIAFTSSRNGEGEIYVTDGSNIRELIGGALTSTATPTPTPPAPDLMLEHDPIPAPAVDPAAVAPPNPAAAGTVGTLEISLNPGPVGASGLAGGPFRGASKTLRLTNNSPGGPGIDWEAVVSEEWVTASPAVGNLAGGASVSVEVSVNDRAIRLGPGSHAAKVWFVNSTSSQENLAYEVELDVTSMSGPLDVTSMSGPPDGGEEAPSIVAPDSAGDAEDVEGEQVRRGFFANSTTASVDGSGMGWLGDATTLALVGIVVTVAAAGVQIFRGG